MSSDNTYAIGAVSRLLGLSTHALRKWEIRHGAVAPARSEGGDRRYSRDDLERLTKLKELVDAGHPIGTIARLSGAELDELLGRRPVEPGGDAVRIAVLGGRLWQALQEAQEKLRSITIVGHFENADEALGIEADAIVADIPSLTENTRLELQAIRKHTAIDRLVIVYRYGSISLAESLSDDRTALFARPVNYRELQRALRSIVADPYVQRPAIGLPQHKFTRKVLTDVAMMAPALACECPRHVAQIIIDLSDFEAYSAECEQTKPEDAVVHAMLRRTAATSRSLFEDALIELADYEGIDLET